MDRAMLQWRLVQAEEHVLLGRRHVARQRELVADLERDGRDTVQAKRLLANFEAMQAMHLADRNRVHEELTRGS